MAMREAALDAYLSERGAQERSRMVDIVRASADVHARWDAIVLDGERHVLGMPGYRDAITPEDSRAIQAYVVSRARATLGQQAASAE